MLLVEGGELRTVIRDEHREQARRLDGTGILADQVLAARRLEKLSPGTFGGFSTATSFTCAPDSSAKQTDADRSAATTAASAPRYLWLERPIPVRNARLRAAGRGAGSP